MTPTRREFFDTNVAYYWAHLVMLLGIVCIAAGLERAIGHAFDSLSFARALELGGGTALYLAGHAFFRRVLGLSFKPWRAVALVLALATIPLGTATFGTGPACRPRGPARHLPDDSSWSRRAARLQATAG